MLFRWSFKLLDEFGTSDCGAEVLFSEITSPESDSLVTFPIDVPFDCESLASIKSPLGTSPSTRMISIPLFPNQTHSSKCIFASVPLTVRRVSVDPSKVIARKVTRAVGPVTTS